MQSVAFRFASALSLRLRQRVAQLCGVPGAIRTLDPLLIRQLLCPTELQGQTIYGVNLAQGWREGQINLVTNQCRTMIYDTILSLYSPQTGDSQNTKRNTSDYSSKPAKET